MLVDLDAKIKASLTNCKHPSNIESDTHRLQKPSRIIRPDETQIEALELSKKSKNCFEVARNWKT